MIEREDQSVLVGKQDEAHCLVQNLSMPPFEERSFRLPVRAVLQLRETERVWFVVGSREVHGSVELMGYAPTGRYGSPGDGWFVLATDFFDRAAGATGDVLQVFIPEVGIALEHAEVVGAGEDWCALGPGALQDVFTTN